MIISKYSLKLQTCIFNFLFHSSTWLLMASQTFHVLYNQPLDLSTNLPLPQSTSQLMATLFCQEKLMCHSTFLFHTLSIKRNPLEDIQNHLWLWKLDYYHHLQTGLVSTFSSPTQPRASQ